jgi:hypothetical protein
MAMYAAHPHTAANRQASSLNYFICTLGQMAECNSKYPHTFHTVNEFLEAQARLYPEMPAIGFPIPADRSRNWGYELFCWSFCYHSWLGRNSVYWLAIAFQDLPQGSIACIEWATFGSFDWVEERYAMCCTLILKLCWLLIHLASSDERRIVCFTYSVSPYFLAFRTTLWIGPFLVSYCLMLNLSTISSLPSQS